MIKGKKLSSNIILDRIPQCHYVGMNIDTMTFFIPDHQNKYSYVSMFLQNHSYS